MLNMDNSNCIFVDDGAASELFNGAAELELVLQPWERHSYRLISWLEMLQFSARMFFWCGLYLRTIKNECILDSIPVAANQKILNVARDLSDTSRSRALIALRHVEAEFRKIGLRISADAVKDIVTILENKTDRRNCQWLMDQIGNIERLAERELEGKAFFYVPAERAKFFPRSDDQHIFGSEVAVAFQSATYDIAEAGICLALARGSGCVFHLMRVLEIGLTALGGKFGVSLEHTNWNPAIEEIESKIRGMHKDPTWKAQRDYREQQEFYAQVASHFGILKDAWRNYTMHVRGKYTEEEAELIFENVKAFTQKLAKRLHD